MGWFSSPKKIKRDEFKKTLKDIPQLSQKERAYVEGIFRNPSKKGLTKREIEKEINQLRRDTDDPISSHEASKLKQALEKSLQEEKK